MCNIFRESICAYRLPVRGSGMDDRLSGGLLTPGMFEHNKNHRQTGRLRFLSLFVP